MTQYRYQQSVRTLTRDFLKKLKNPDLNLDGSLKPASSRKSTHHPRNLSSLHYDQNDPFAVAKASMSQHQNEPGTKAVTSGASDGKPSFEIDNSKNIMLLMGAATDTRVIIESFLQANVRTRSKYKCCVLHCCTRENKITHDSYYIVKNIIQQIVRTVPAIRNLLLLQNHDYFSEILSSKASLNKQLKLQQEAPAILVKFCKVLQQIKLDFNICVFITGIENVFDMGDLQNIVYVIRSLTCHSLYMPPYLRFVIAGEKRESKTTQFDLIVKLLQTKKIYDVYDSSFYENESYSLLEFVYTYTEQQRQQSARRSVSQNEISAGEGSSKEVPVAQVQPMTSKADKDKLIKSILAKSQNSYRVIIDILVKLNQSRIELSILKESTQAIQAYSGDHVRFLPKIQQQSQGSNSGTQPQVIEGEDAYDRMFTRTILQSLTQICGPISFKLFAKICHCLMLTKQFVKQHRADQKQLPQPNTEVPNTSNLLLQHQQSKEDIAAERQEESAQRTPVGGVERQESLKSNAANQPDEMAQTMNNLSAHIIPQQNDDKENSNEEVTKEDKGQDDKLNVDEVQKQEDQEAVIEEKSKDNLNVNCSSPMKIENEEEKQQKPLGGMMASADGEYKGVVAVAAADTMTNSNENTANTVQAADATDQKQNDQKEDGAETGSAGGKGGMTKKNKNLASKKTDIEQVVQHVMSLLTLEQGVPEDFQKRLMDKLVSIGDFLHLIVKDKISTNRRRRDHDSQQSSSEDDESDSEQASSNLMELLQAMQNMQASGEYVHAMELQSEIQSKLLIVPRKRKMLKACMSVLRVTKSRYFDAVCQVIALHEFSGESSLTRDMDLPWMPPVPYETIDPYLRLYIYHHWSKSEAKQSFTSFEGLLTAENIFKQIVYFGSYGRLRQNLRLVLNRSNCEDKEIRGITYLMNTLYLIQQTLKYEPINYLDFCTQFRGRVIGDAGARNLPDLKFDELIRLSGNTDVCYFENFHHALRENPRIDLIVTFPGCQILTLKFFADKKRIMLSLSNGLLILFNTETNQVLKVYVQSHAVIDKIKIIDDRYIICAGIDSKHRIWNIENQKQVSKFEMHGYCTSQMVIYKEFLITYGYSRTLVKFNFMKKKYDCWQETSSYLTNLKLLKTNDKAQPVKLIASFSDGDIILYSVELNTLCHINRSMQESALRIICLSLSECLFFQKDGQINVLSGSILEETKAGSIFSLKSDDYIDMILIKSREYFLFTIEKQKIEFFNASTFKRSDSWDYFFERDIVGCDKNKEGSKICVWDKGGYLTLFNFLKHLDNTQKQFNTPSHRRYDPVVCIDVTERLGEKNQVISCSLERDLRVWSRDTGLFLKKYDLSSFTAENVSTIKLGKSEGMLFLGSKDMNVYLIDVARGKLCVVYEGHWSRVTSIYTLPGKDILVTLSESNIKVWDLEYDECIKNMNDHSSLIVYCAQSHKDDQLIVTISQNLEYKEWNYVTGDIVKQYMIDLGGVSDDQDEEELDDSGDQRSQNDSHVDAQSDRHSDSDDSDGSQSSDDAMVNPQGDESVGASAGAARQRGNHQQQNRARRQHHRRGKSGRAVGAPQPESKPKNLVACHVSQQGFAYLAIDNNKIIVYNLLTKEVQSIFESYQCQTVIYLLSIETDKADYLIVVTRTSCVLYSLHVDGVRRMTSYLLNSRKRPYRTIEENRFSYQVRFYFTSAKVVKAVEDDSSSDQTSPNKGRGGLSGGFGLLGSDFNMNQINYDDAISQAQDYLQNGLKTPEIMVHDDMSQGGAGQAGDIVSMRQSLGGASSVQMLAQNHAETYKNAIESLSQSPLPAHNALALSLQRSQNINNGPGSQSAAFQQHLTQLQQIGQSSSQQQLIAQHNNLHQQQNQQQFQTVPQSRAPAHQPGTDHQSSDIQSVADQGQNLGMCMGGGTTTIASNNNQLMLATAKANATTSFINCNTSSHNFNSKRQKYLVYLGDSRGQVHMVSLYLS